ncbi:SUMF1/EgtB/PvdO family nonheme iron enzyme [Sorangium sp. So ce1036]|uniref:SUMF1/EgtB/PvdO family nonheme iron enzyme n=1 Tax=Sorangium sp. So ce1036 TaxID=3133328 RepID=UPI003F00EB5B
MSEGLAAELSERLGAAFRRTDELFARIPDDRLLERPIALRHPFLFYLGHLPAFAWNQVGRGVLGAGHLDRALDVLFARGIDPSDGDDARASLRTSWPSIAEIRGYRDAARRAVLDRVPSVLERKGDLLCDNGRVVHLVLEHELMHQETLMYMLAACPEGSFGRAPAPLTHERYERRPAEPRRIPAGPATLGADWDEIPFGWDNEFGETVIAVPAFTLDSLPVTNRDWLAFREAGGSSPRSWVEGRGGLSVRTVHGPLPFELLADAPVQVTGEEARAYCAFVGGRLPTEAELYRAAYACPDGSRRLYPWGDDPPAPRHGHFGFRGSLPAPVGLSPDGASAWGVEELLGNGWEWTATPFAPLPGFCAYARTYPGYSADFFGGAHDVVFGASWATDERLLRRSFRNWYRRSYPHAFTSFRVARGGAP